MGDVILTIGAFALVAFALWLNRCAELRARRRENTELRRALSREREENRRNAARMAARRVHARWDRPTSLLDAWGAQITGKRR